MTVSSNYKEITYLCNGITTEFTIPWKFFENEIRVFKNKTEVWYILGKDYTIEKNADSTGTVKFSVAPDNESYITIVRDVPLNQRVRFIEGENFPADEYEYSLDRIYMALQEVRTILSRCPKAPAGEEDWNTYIGRFLQWTSGGRTGIYYNPDYTYKTGYLVLTTDQNWWISLKDDNKGNTPSEVSDYWHKFASVATKASDVDVDVSDFQVITGGNLQEALKQLDLKLVSIEDNTSLLICLDILNDLSGGVTEVPLQSLQADLHEGRPSHKALGAWVYDENNTLGVIDRIEGQTAYVYTVIGGGKGKKPSQVVDTSTTEFPSNNAVKVYVEGIVGNINKTLDEINGEII